MAKIDQAKLEETILSGQEWTYQHLVSFFGANEKAGMQIDRTLQKLRRKGKVKFHREGRTVIWQRVSEPATM